MCFSILGYGYWQNRLAHFKAMFIDMFINFRAKINFSAVKMQAQEPLVNDKFLLEKAKGKGGWTYTVLPETVRKKKTPFGWIQVNGFIDDFELKAYRLMPMSSGQLFLPVRAEIRKKIKKKEGDWIHVVLYADNAPADIPEEFLLCLQDNEEAYSNFLKCTDLEQRAFINHIYSAKREDTRIQRIVQTLQLLETGQRLPK
ncbi:YdeI/OmpD-associated family protein [Mucilaginibacter calamicampi]|uniref:YdeI/OmpD-associated family protein n=1 Tax=Mucilaginibacter calamicampi TaxID=1302352 RepID=A0ABW2YX82_9SPHI